MTDTLPLQRAQRRLATVWLVSAAATSLLLIAQTQIGNVYADRTAAVWQWYLPSTFPTLALVIGVLVNAEINPPARRQALRRRVSTFFYRVALVASAFYLALILLHPALTAFRHGAVAKLALLEASGIYLGPIQGLVSAALGVFFLSADEDHRAATDITT